MHCALHEHAISELIIDVLMLVHPDLPPANYLASTGNFALALYAIPDTPFLMCHAAHPLLV